MRPFQLSEYMIPHHFFERKYLPKAPKTIGIHIIKINTVCFGVIGCSPPPHWIALKFNLRVCVKSQTLQVLPSDVTALTTRVIPECSLYAWGWLWEQ